MVPTSPPASLRLRLPRVLLDPQQRDLPCGDQEGLLTVELSIAQGRIARIQPSRGAGAPLALTPLVDPHVHLDKAFTWPAYPNPSGTMDSALAANLREGEQRSREQVLERGERALEQAWRYGLRALRSHVDSGGSGAEPSWEALLELRERWRGRVELQLVALVPVPVWSTAMGRQLAARVAAAGGLLGGVLGPPFPPGAGAAGELLALLQLADRLGCGVDLHVDEGGDQWGHGVALLTSLLERHGVAIPVTCSHSSSMALLPEPLQRKLAERMAAAGLAVVALPSTNFWLLGRRHGLTAAQRPVAPVQLLQQAGVAVALGADNVQDPWFPGGDFDPLELLRLAGPCVHLAPWQRQGLMPFTSVPARLLGLPWDGVVRQGAPADLVVLAASTWSELLARTPQRRVLRAGQWLPPPLAQQADARLAALS